MSELSSCVNREVGLGSHAPSHSSPVRNKRTVSVDIKHHARSTSWISERRQVALPIWACSGLLSYQSKQEWEHRHKEIIWQCESYHQLQLQLLLSGACVHAYTCHKSVVTLQYMFTNIHRSLSHSPFHFYTDFCFVFSPLALCLIKFTGSTAGKRDKQCGSRTTLSPLTLSGARTQHCSAAGSISSSVLLQDSSRPKHFLLEPHSHYLQTCS